VCAGGLDEALCNVIAMAREQEFPFVFALHSKDGGGNRVMGLKNTYTPPHNILDSSAPRLKRGKEREIPKVKKTTAMKKVLQKTHTHSTEHDRI